MSESIDNEFRQKIAIALAGNTEFVKIANEDYRGKYVGFCVGEQILLTIQGLSAIEVKESKQ